MHSRQMALDHLWAPGEVSFVSLRSAHSIVRPSSVEPQERGKNLLLHSHPFPYSSEWKEKKHNGSMGKWQDGGVGQKRHPKEEERLEHWPGCSGGALRLGQREAGSKGSRLVSGWRAGRWSAVVLTVAPICQSVKRCGTS